VKGTVERKGFLKLRELRLDGAEGLRSYLLKGGDEVLFPNKEELTGVFTRVRQWRRLFASNSSAWYRRTA
jgi:hypothetical protein